MNPKVFHETVPAVQSRTALQSGAGPRMHAGWVFSDETSRDGSVILQMGDVSLDPSFFPDDLIFE